MSGLKRKRGRPRRDEAREINNFDLLLIDEYRKRPAFYDREHPHYRNRELLEPEWHAMARAMNCSVPYIKDRLTILRNRYSLEKRRVDSLQSQYKDSSITSQWPLYDNLSFLNDVIKTRRSFNSFNAPKAPSSNSSNDNQGNGDVADDDEDDDEESRDLKSYKDSRLISPPPPHLQHGSFNVQNDVRFMMPSGATSSHQNPRINYEDSGMTRNSRSVAEIQNLPGSDKFNAFGHFLASSLIEMQEKEALRLVEKFTIELVNTMLDAQ